MIGFVSLWKFKDQLKIGFVSVFPQQLSHTTNFIFALQFCFLVLVKILTIDTSLLSSCFFIKPIDLPNLYDSEQTFHNSATKQPRFLKCSIALLCRYAANPILKKSGFTHTMRKTICMLSSYGGENIKNATALALYLSTKTV